jgi:hypothetical protein
MPNYGGLYVAGSIQSIGVSMPKTNYKLKPGGRICRCPACGEAFSGIKAFDIHRVGVHAENRSCIRLGGSERHIITTPKGSTKTLVLRTLPRGTFWGILNE